MFYNKEAEQMKIQDFSSKTLTHFILIEMNMTAMRYANDGHLYRSIH